MRENREGESEKKNLLDEDIVSFALHELGNAAILVELGEEELVELRVEAEDDNPVGPLS